MAEKTPENPNGIPLIPGHYYVYQGKEGVWKYNKYHDGYLGIDREEVCGANGTWYPVAFNYGPVVREATKEEWDAWIDSQVKKLR